MLLKNADLYTPKHLGIVDVLIKDNIIYKIAKNIKADCDYIDCGGKIVCPCFVDGHEHLTIKGLYYTPQGIINSGVNTVVGVLAEEEDIVSVENLIEKTNQLNKNYNLTAYCLAGSKNFVHNFENFITENECVVGIKTALFTSQRPKPNLSYDKLKNDSLKTYNAGLKSGKNVQVHIHLDHPFGRGMPIPSVEEINSGKIDNLHWIDKIVEETGVPYSLFKLTHSEKFHDRILEFANKGVYLDYTATHLQDTSKFNSLLKALKSKKYDLSKFSISSDLSLLTLERGMKGEETPYTLLNTIRQFVLVHKFNFEEVLPLVTTNALAPIVKKEELIYVGAKSNFLILNSNLEIENVIN